MQTLAQAVGFDPGDPAGDMYVESVRCARHDRWFPQKTIHAGREIAGRCPQCVIEENNERAKQDQVALARRRAEDEAKKKRDELEQRLQRSLIPERFAEYTLDGFPVPPLQADAKQQAVVLAACRSYVNTWIERRKRGEGLVFVGPNGRGKTGLACGIANALMRDAHASALFMSVRGVIRHQADTWGRKGKTESDALKELTEPDLLIIDEAGVQAGTDMEMVLLTEVINDRYAYRRPTFLISNLPVNDYHPGNDKDKPRQPGLKTRLGSRIWSRFEDTAQVLTCSWPTLRGGPK